ncbi:hypothetical protein Nhal_1033 [Nitrosococcus halophilus Nc 4]|uniref:Uncharacterized protein n=1 Tax=Nitrosococcus halophilus (strain Nc4) TaxID=472759 RepID=D5BYZ3_NITHN|nr:hypothetical protein [Nitrosococcus halophilus]ADE14206.1 hypothetical protein Nhal_1033 [Nitrosococcus halophilus Nc 4]
MQEKSTFHSSADTLWRNESQSLSDQTFSIKRIVEAWAREVQGEADIMTVILYLDARGDFIEYDPNVARFFTPMNRPESNARVRGLHETEFYSARLLPDGFAQHEIALEQVLDFCERHQVPYPACLPSKSTFERQVQCQTTQPRTGSPRNAAALQAKRSIKAERRQRLREFLEEAQKRAEKEGYSLFRIDAIPVTKRDFHKVFFRIYKDIPGCAAATLADDLREIGARFRRGTRSRKNNVLEQLFPR